MDNDSVTNPQMAVGKKAKLKVFSRAKDPKAIVLTERDATALEALWRHRCLSGDQLRRLVFRCGPSMLRRRLRALYDNGLIDRVRVAAMPARGISPFVYVVARGGMEVLPELLARYRPDLAADIDETAGVTALRGAGLRFIAHRYMVNETHVTLEEAARQRGYTVRWLHEEELTIGGVSDKRRAEVVKYPSLREPMTFLPDAYFELRTPNGKSFAFFVEIDMANHPQRVWRDRAKLYNAYADPRFGLFRRRFGRETFRLLIVTTPDYRQRSRCDNILQTIERTIGPTDMFVGVTSDSLDAAHILQPCWRTADGTGRRVALVPIPAVTRTVPPAVRVTPVVARPAPVRVYAHRPNRATVESKSAPLTIHNAGESQ